MNDSRNHTSSGHPLKEKVSSPLTELKRPSTHLRHINKSAIPRAHHVFRIVRTKGSEVLAAGNVKDIKSTGGKKRRVKINKNINQNLADAMSKMRLYEYTEYLNHPFRLLFMNFLIGIARGLGATIGLAVVLIIGIHVAQNIISANLPLISAWVLEIFEFVNDYYRW